MAPIRSDSTGDHAADGTDHHTAVLVQRAADGEERAVNELFPLIYDELRSLAGRIAQGPGAARSIRPTALVHEAYLKLVGAAQLDWNTQTHFRAIAARAMQQILIDHARGLGRAKRGGGWDRVTLSDAPGDNELISNVDAISDALIRLGELDQRAATVVMLRFLGGLDDQGIAAQLGVTDRTVRNDWRMARAWLQSNLDRSTGTAE